MNCPGGQSPEKVCEEQAYTLGTTAYLWGFTMNELYRFRSTALAKPGAAVNKFDHNRTLLTPEQAHVINVVRANNPRNPAVMRDRTFGSSASRHGES
jgi:hypothetical protein